MKSNFNKQTYYYFLLIFIIGTIVFSTVNIYDFGIHIEEKYHRMNGHYWLNFVANFFNLENLEKVTQAKLNDISDYTVSSVSYYNKYGVIFDLPVALIEILFNINDIKKVYYLKHFISFFIFLISSIFFFKIINERYKNSFLGFVGAILFITTPRIFGDSFLYKDVLFLSFFVISLYYLLKLSVHINLNNLIYFALFCAISFNLRIFAIFLPITFFLLLIIKSFYDKKIYSYLKSFLLYFLILTILIILFSPYLWTNTLNNLLDIFRPMERASIGEHIKILFNNNFFPNRNVPESYLFVWIFITTPIITIIFFLLGYLNYSKRFLLRFINIKETQIFNDLWRGKNEQKDFINFFLFTSFILTLLVFNAPFYNGWRLVYFLNIFIIYFAIYQINFLTTVFRKKRIGSYVINFFVIFSIIYNIVVLVNYHPFQSYYFSELITNNKKNGFEGDYYGLSGKHFFLKLNSDYNNKKLKIAVASHTPLHRSLESLEYEVRKKFEVVGQEYADADFIYKNNISEVNSRLNKKYNIPDNFVKIFELNINGLKLYEIFKNLK